jgi:hypothetical protein
VRDADGDTPLMACEDPACADLLLGAGADLTAVNAEGASAYYIATWDARADMIAWFRAKYAAFGLAVPEVPEPPADDDGGAVYMSEIIEEEPDAVNGGGGSGDATAD